MFINEILIFWHHSYLKQSRPRKWLFGKGEIYTSHCLDAQEAIAPLFPPPILLPMWRFGHFRSLAKDGGKLEQSPFY